MEKSNLHKRKICILLFFSLITVALLIAVDIYCDKIIQRSKQKYLLPYHNTSKLEEIETERKIIKMESDDELKETNIKNRTCYYFDDIIKLEDFAFDNILLDKKSYKTVLTIVY